MFALLSANLINVLANWVFIHGKMGLPALGSTGAGVATTISRLYMAGVIWWAILAGDGPALCATGWGLELARIGRIARLGFPAAMQITLEVGVFSLMTTVAGRFAAADLAAHQIALQIVSVAFMFPLGVGSASSVRVGHAVGRRDPRGVAWSGWSGVVLATAIMGFISLVMVACGPWLLRGFTTKAEVIATAVRLLWISACLQIFDAWQVVSTGNLRGVGNTRTPMLWNVVTHWGIGMPVGLGLGVGLGWSVIGLWFGLYAGLTLTGIVLVMTWFQITRRLQWDPAYLTRLAREVRAVEEEQPALV
jgi:MATE family multidrug resistance protein